jgi:hypothetical protein
MRDCNRAGRDRKRAGSKAHIVRRPINRAQGEGDRPQNESNRAHDKSNRAQNKNKRAPLNCRLSQEILGSAARRRRTLNGEL